ncbi:PglZ domain-containing protein [Pontibacter lucknowensis]|uniref:PglZ domain-containing protein n=1 Tax=Pontibacter lucknowensis TaxID=1077936 RepID=A0A1N6TIC2_9BACT|nr:PglZ domain-containing protein [Pontibacter lucknowensis]SIQ53095.1 PglZ domain-containing protein [Pontibacter lucknowensis]
MANAFVNHIAEEFLASPKRLILVRNPDGFLRMPEVQKALKAYSIRLCDKQGIDLRIDFELRYKATDQQADKTVYLISSLEAILEDIASEGEYRVFHLADYFPEYNFNFISGCSLSDLNLLFANKPLTNLSKQETENHLATLRATANSFDLGAFKQKAEVLLGTIPIDWYQVIELLSDALVQTVGTAQAEQVWLVVNQANTSFQEELSVSFKSSLNSSPIKRPQVVSRILPHLSFKHTKDKIALIVVDGMAYWQYQLLRDSLEDGLKLEEGVTYSWIPSITQLSRQAIFRGDAPTSSYEQKPKNEENLWHSFWKRKGISPTSIRYSHDTVEPIDLDKVTKYALVFKELDDKMHSSSDYVDLKSLTENWLAKEKISNAINTLLELGFILFLTTDHGNIQAQGWRSLKDREKLGTTKTGSRSARHLGYSDQWLAEDFIKLNADIAPSVAYDGKGIYFKDTLSFSNEESLVTHGGSHILEVLIPFVKITHG